MKGKVCLLLTLILLCCGCSSKPAVATDGSTSMNQVMGRLGEAFENQTGISILYNATGSGSGIQAVAQGRCDIGLSSRELKEEEMAAGLQTTLLAYDGIAVVVHPDNPLNDISQQDLYGLFTGKITNWNQLIGGNGVVVPIGREAGSGTRDGFETATGTAHQCRYRQELTSNGDVITTVSNNPNAVGYVSLAAVKNSVKILAVEGVYPNKTTLQEGSYKVQRPFLLVTQKNTPLSQEAQAFMDYVTSEQAYKIIAGGGVVPAKSKER